jgi:hypothetical protein
VINSGHQYDSEEGADVEDDEFLAEGPGESEEEKDGDTEEDVTACFDAGSLLVGGEVLGRRVGQPDSPGVLTFGCSLLCSLYDKRGKCGV